MSMAAAPGPCVIRLDGSLTLSRAPEIRDSVARAFEDHASVTVDVSAADDADLALLQILLSSKSTAKATGKAFLIAAPSDGLVLHRFASAAIAHASQPERIDAVPAAAVSTSASASRAQGETPPKWVNDASDLDPKALETLLKELGPEAVGESLEVFFAEIDTRVRALKSLNLKSELSVILREAHSLKGTAGTFGLRRLSAYGAELERAAPALDSEAYAQMLARIEATVSGAREALRTSALLAA